MALSRKLTATALLAMLVVAMAVSPSAAQQQQQQQQQQQNPVSGPPLPASQIDPLPFAMFSCEQGITGWSVDGNVVGLDQSEALQTSSLGRAKT